MKRKTAKGKNAFVTLLIADIALFAVYGLSMRILSMNHLAYRNAVNYSVYATLVVIKLIIIVQAIVFLFNLIKRKQVASAIRVLSGVGIAALIVAVAFASLSMFIRGVFSHQPEHVVERDGRVMLARVDSFLQVEVRYYKHINALVRGTHIYLHEDYGNGGYDPFERENMPEVQRYIYYDENGDIIESNWFDNYPITIINGGYHLGM